MSEEHVNIPVEDGEITLEGLFEQGRISRNVVLCHPHPLYGGDMQNDVIRAAKHTFVGLGWGTLRFNFRGTGASGGQPAQGQEDARDLIAVAEFLRERSPGSLDFGAYSYGAWVAMEAIRMGLSPDSVLLISPPLDFMSFESFDLPDAPTLIAVGDRDQFCSIGSLQKWLSNMQQIKQPVIEVLSGVDHFYWGAERRLTEKIETFFKAVKGGSCKNREPSG